MEIQILKWFLLFNIALSIVVSIAMIGQERPKYSISGAIASLVVNVPVAVWILHALS